MAKNDELGTKFWLWLAGIGLALFVGTIVIFLVLSAAWYRWGAFGTLAFICAVGILIAWLWDRHELKEYEKLG